METIKDAARMRDWSRAVRLKGGKILFVPTMGALHEGHLSLVRLAGGMGGRVVVSIYVNPTQFGPGEDYRSYPRDLARDSAMLEQAGVAVLFAPENLYAPGSLVTVDPGPMASVLCGQSRPGHFKGVATVVMKLFHIVAPDVGVFGQKDAQQVAIIERMVADLNLSVRIIAAPTVREADGLALSSRNVFLNPEERSLAPSLYHALLSVRERLDGGDADAERALAAAVRTVRGELEYLQAVDRANLTPVKRLASGILIAGAMRLGRTRLIDNIIL